MFEYFNSLVVRSSFNQAADSHTDDFTLECVHTDFIGLGSIKLLIVPRDLLQPSVQLFANAQIFDHVTHGVSNTRDQRGIEKR